MSVIDARGVIDWDTVPLGTKSDAAIATELKVTREAVRAQRKKRGISVFAPMLRQKPDKLSRIEIARKAGRVTSARKTAAVRANGKKSRGPKNVSASHKAAISAAQSARWQKHWEERIERFNRPSD